MDLIRNARYQLLTFYPALILCLMVANFSFGELIGYWNLNDANEAQDSSGNNNHGKIEGKPKSVAGKIKTALEFNGSSDWVSIEHNDSIADFDQLSISAWIKLIKINGWTAVIEKGIHENWSYGFFLEPDSTLSFYVSQKGNKLACCIGDYKIKPEKWHFIAGLYDGKIAKLIVDDKEQAQMAAKGVLHPTEGLPLTIGSRNGNNKFNGVVDEVTLWNEAVTLDDLHTPLSVSPRQRLAVIWAQLKGRL